MAAWCFFVLLSKGKWDETVVLIKSLDSIDYLLFGIIGNLCVTYQTLRYMANQYEEPGKLSQYQYTNVFYTLSFDMLIFNKSFSGL